LSENDGKEKTYDILVERHGPKPPWLEEGFPLIWKACLKLKERWEAKPKHLDFTRIPLPWKDVFNLSDEFDEVGTRPRPERYRLVAFDLDGTLLRGENYTWSWPLVWQHLNYKDTVRRRLMDEYVHVKRHTHKNWYKEWCDRSATLFRRKGLKRADFKAITKDLVPVDGLYETLRALKQEGTKLAIVSGGIDVFLDEKIPDHMEYFDFVYINKFRFDQQGLFTGITTTRYDFEGKFTAIEEICEQEGFGTDHVVFVGDGFNDAHLLGKVGLFVALAPFDMELRNNADVVIADPDLRKILPHILKASESR
jgi:HAD superfamily phosphoserine phosphatase-like hydrolase